MQGTIHSERTPRTSPGCARSKVQSRTRLPGDVRVHCATAPLASKLPSCDGTEDAVNPTSFWRSLLCAPQTCGLSTLTCKRFTPCPSLCVPQSLSPKPSLIKWKLCASWASKHLKAFHRPPPQLLHTSLFSEHPFCIFPLDEAWLSLEDTVFPSRPSNQ